MSIYTTSTLQTERVTITTIQRICILFKNIVIVSLPLAIMLALCIRSPIYFSANVMIGVWNTTQDNLPNLDNVNTFQFLMMFLPTFIQYPLFTLLL